MERLSVSQARDSLYELVDEVAEHHQPVVIAGKRNNAVLISQEDWNAIQESLYLNSIPHLVESIQQVAQEPIEEYTELEDLEW